MVTYNQSRGPQHQPKRLIVTLFEGATRTPDYVNIRSEDAVIGVLLQDPSHYGDVAHKLSRYDFHQPFNAFAYKAIESAIDNGMNVGLVTISEILETYILQYPDIFKTPKAAITSELSRLIGSVPNVGHISSYADSVFDAAQRGRVITAYQAGSRDASNRSKPIGGTIDATSKAIQTTVALDVNAKNDLADIAQAYKPGMVQPLVKTGFTEFDDKFGLARGTTTIWAGLSGWGKSTAMLSLITSAIKAGRRVEWFSFELTKLQIIQTMIASEAGIWKKHLRRGKLSGRQLDYDQAVETVSSWNMRIYDKTDIPHPYTTDAVNRYLYSSPAANEIDIVVIDGLWLMRLEKPTAGKYDDWATIVTEFCNIAGRFNAAFLIAHQYNKGVNQLGEDEDPRLEILRGGEQIGHSADSVCMMLRKRKFGQKTKIHQPKGRFDGGCPDPLTWYYNVRRAQYQEIEPSVEDSHDLAF